MPKKKQPPKNNKMKPRQKRKFPRAKKGKDDFIHPDPASY
jgi:hypothetical protein